MAMNLLKILSVVLVLRCLAGFPSEFPLAFGREIQKESQPHKEPVKSSAAISSKPKASPSDEQKWGATFALNFPTPLSGELDYFMNTQFSAALGAGGLSVLLPQKQGLSPEASVFAYEARTRWHPRHGSFFIGVALGSRILSVKVSKDISLPTLSQVAQTEIEAKMSNFFATPHIGWLWVWKSGFTFGVEAGVQIVFPSQVELQSKANNIEGVVALAALTQTSDYQDLKSQVQRYGDQFGNIPLPYVTVLRIGWVF